MSTETNGNSVGINTPTLFNHALAAGVPTPQNLDDVQRMAQMLAFSGYFKNSTDLKQAVAQTGVKILAGQALGIHPIAAVMHMHLINGKLGYEAVIMAAAIQKRGYSFRPVKHDETQAEIEFFNQEGDSIGVSGFTIKDAKNADLLAKDVWRKFPKNMLWARAMSNGCRWYCPHCFGGTAPYTPEELGAQVDESGQPVIEIQASVVDAAQSEQTADLNAKLQSVKSGNGGTHKAASEADTEPEQTTVQPRREQLNKIDPELEAAAAAAVADVVGKEGE